MLGVIPEHILSSMNGTTLPSRPVGQHKLVGHPSTVASVRAAALARQRHLHTAAYTIDFCNLTITGVQAEQYRQLVWTASLQG